MTEEFRQEHHLRTICSNYIGIIVYFILFVVVSVIVVLWSVGIFGENSSPNITDPGIVNNYHYNNSH